MLSLGKRWRAPKSDAHIRFAHFFPDCAMQFRHLVLCLVLIATGAPVTVLAREMNGFDLKDSLIPGEQIHFGGPPKDGIPAIDHPKFTPGEFAAFLRDDDAVLGIARSGIARAYPVRILNWHEVVNDRFEDEAVVITFCPLCGTGVAFNARIEGRVLNFGVSGLLYNSDVLLYDRQTQSLWSQLLGQAISGPMKGHHLKMLPLSHTTWADWRKSHPATEVLSANTGMQRPYERDPYAGYERSEEIMFPSFGEHSSGLQDAGARLSAQSVADRSLHAASRSRRNTPQTSGNIAARRSTSSGRSISHRFAGSVQLQPKVERRSRVCAMTRSVPQSTPANNSCAGAFMPIST